MDKPPVITVETTILVPAAKTWDLWISPQDITSWNFATPAWYCPFAKNTPVPGGGFRFRMEARDGSAGFDFSGIYTQVVPLKQLSYTLDDGRKVDVHFRGDGDSTRITESFEADRGHSTEMQKAGWQAILENFKEYAESRLRFVKANFTIEINAAAAHIFKILTDKKGFSDWTSVFNPTSHYEGSWKKGSKIRFLGEDEHGKITGMVSEIREFIPGIFISIVHHGQVRDGIEVMEGPGVDEWSGALEEYFLRENEGRTELKVSMDIIAEFRNYFEMTWPRALQKLKEICES